MRSWASSLCALLIAGAAHATPPEIVDVEDRLFARTEDRLYLLRHFTSNDGLHSVIRTDILLITRTLTEGDDRGYRGVARVVDIGPWDDVEPRTRPVALPSPANPYALFADGAWPLDGPRPPHPENAILLPSGLHGILESAEGMTNFHLPAAALSDRIVDTLASSRAVLPFERLGGGSTGPDPFDPSAYDPDRHCSVIATLPLRDYDADPMLVQIECEVEEDGLQQARLWIVVPKSDD